MLTQIEWHGINEAMLYQTTEFRVKKLENN
jgi:hypothetical protein